MKLFVLEGLDNTGKTYIGTKFKEYLEANGFPNVHYIHFIAPKGNTPEECAYNEHQFSLKIAKDIQDAVYNQKYDAIILDRSWYSEYVYGQIYRERTADDCLVKIRSVEDIIINTFDDIKDTFYISFTADSGFLKDHEDGHSLSEADTNIIRDEIVKFNELLDNVMLGNIIKLDVQGKNGKYKTVKSIISQITDILYNKDND